MQSLTVFLFLAGSTSLQVCCAAFRGFLVVKCRFWIHVLLHKDLLALSITWCASELLHVCCNVSVCMCACVCVCAERETEITLFPQKSISANRIAFPPALLFPVFHSGFYLPRLVLLYPLFPLLSTPNFSTSYSTFHYSLFSSSPQTEHQLHFITSRLAAAHQTGRFTWRQ